MKQAYEADKKNWLTTDSERTRGLFKPEFVGTRGVWLTAKCYQNEALNKNKYSCKGISKKHNDLYLYVFLKTRRDSESEEKDIDKAKNMDFRVYDQGIVRYEHSKLGLSAYYDKRYVLAGGIHTRPLDC